MGYPVVHFILCRCLPRETEGGNDKDHHEAFCVAGGRSHVEYSFIPRLFPLQFLIAYSIQKQSIKAINISRQGNACKAREKRQ